MNKEFIVDNNITNKFIETYTKTTYRIIGNNKHSAVKPCLLAALKFHDPYRLPPYMILNSVT